MVAERVIDFVAPEESCDVGAELRGEFRLVNDDVSPELHLETASLYLILDTQEVIEVNARFALLFDFGF